jgi:nucleoside-diphosphate-sugar epimerase
MRALVTGATGFIGGRLTERLLARGDTVRVLARRPEAAAPLAALGASVCAGDLGQPERLAEACRDVEVVFHCAGLSSDWGPWRDFEAVNVQGARALAEAAARVPGLRRFVHISTTDVFGYPEVVGDDELPVRDVGLPYNRSKLLGEAAVRAVPGLPWVSVRPATVFGPGSKDFGLELARLLARRDMMVVAGGHTPAGLVYVDNLVDALLAAAEVPEALHGCFTVRDETKESWREYLEALTQALGLPRVTLSMPRWLALGLAGASEAAWKVSLASTRPLLTRHAVELMARDQAYALGPTQARLGFRSRVCFRDGVAAQVAWLLRPEQRARWSP